MLATSAIGENTSGSLRSETVAGRFFKGERGGCGFTFGNGCSPSSPAEALFGGRPTTTYHVPPNRQQTDKERA